jgi:hypothetical protein
MKRGRVLALSTDSRFFLAAGGLFFDDQQLNRVFTISLSMR